MRRFSFLALILSCLGAGLSTAYEWRSHNRMAWNARDIFIGEKRSPFPADQQLIDFLRQFGDSDLDTRAGTSFRPFLFVGTDEDYTEGALFADPSFCYYREDGCFPLCSVDHFHPPLQIPVAGEDAYIHAKRYFDWAVKLYKAGICRPGARFIYHKWAARALGHAIHLVQDMGSPQHGGREKRALALALPPEALAFGTNNQCRARNEVSG
jgi:hypothetical protein